MMGEGSISSGNRKSGMMNKAKEEAYIVICNHIKPTILSEIYFRYIYLVNYFFPLLEKPRSPLALKELWSVRD